MKALITATAPTHYQYRSLSHFKLREQNKNPYSSEMVGYTLFNTIKEARNYLKDLANDYYEGDKKAIARHLSKNNLRIDAAYGQILTGSDYMEFMKSSNRKNNG